MDQLPDVYISGPYTVGKNAGRYAVCDFATGRTLGYLVDGALEMVMHERTAEVQSKPWGWSQDGGASFYASPLPPACSLCNGRGFYGTPGATCDLCRGTGAAIPPLDPRCDYPLCSKECGDVKGYCHKRCAATPPADNKENGNG